MQENESKLNINAMYTLNTYPKCKLIELLITDRKRKKKSSWQNIL